MRSLALLALVVVAAVGCAGSDEPALEVTGTIAFTRGEHVWLMSADGSAQRKLTRGSGPSWSPDGSRLAFAVDEGPEYFSSQIFVIGADGRGRLRLTRRDGQQSSPVWSPDGRTIAFQGYDDSAYWISVVRADGTGQRTLTRGYPHEVDTGAVWSRDGRTIVFTNIHENAVYVMKPDGSGRRVLATIKGEWRPPGVLWSPDRRQFTVFVHADLWVMSADGTRLRMLFDSSIDKPGRYSGIAWSPDGRRIAFSIQEGPQRDTEIFVVHSDGSGLRNLTDNDGVLDYAPAWSPDGKTIAFTSDRHGNAEIYVVDADGGNLRNISNSPGTDSEPAWSPAR